MIWYDLEIYKLYQDSGAYFDSITKCKGTPGPQRYKNYVIWQMISSNDWRQIKCLWYEK